MLPVPVAPGPLLQVTSRTLDHSPLTFIQSFEGPKKSPKSRPFKKEAIYFNAHEAPRLIESPTVVDRFIQCLSRIIFRQFALS